MRYCVCCSFVVVLVSALTMNLGQASAAKLKVGDPAPTFVCKDDAGNDWKSKDHYGKKRVVIYSTQRQ